MTIKPLIIDYIRTFVRDDYAANDRIEAQLNEEGWDGLYLYLNAVFFYAIDQHFDGKRDDKAIRRFVADLRSENPEVADEIDPVLAENAIFAVLDESVDLEAPPEVLSRIQTLGIYKALNEANLSDSELDALLTRAAQLAES
jgi:hypothetical protein